MSNRKLGCIVFSGIVILILIGACTYFFFAIGRRLNSVESLDGSNTDARRLRGRLEQYVPVMRSTLLQNVTMRDLRFYKDAFSGMSWYSFQVPKSQVGRVKSAVDIEWNKESERLKRMGVPATAFWTNALAVNMAFIQQPPEEVRPWWFSQGIEVDVHVVRLSLAYRVTVFSHNDDRVYGVVVSP